LPACTPPTSRAHITKTESCPSKGEDELNAYETDDDKKIDGKSEHNRRMTETKHKNDRHRENCFHGNATIPMRVRGDHRFVRQYKSSGLDSTIRWFLNTRPP
jgi:Ni/Co efflux regulator RcnB